jgi:surfeit locus 1 family protein
MRFERTIVLVAALLAAGATARLGVWQLDRAAQRSALQASLDEKRALPPLPAAELARSAEQGSAQHHRRTEVRGQWLAEATVYLENRQMDGRPGFFVVTPLRLADGSALLVQRGWLPRDPQDRTRVQAPPLPAGEVVVAGRIAAPPSRLYEMAPSASGSIRQNLDLAAFAQEWRLPLRPLSLLQEAPAGSDALQRRWLVPAAGVHKHHGYAAQWFALSALIIGLYVWFQLVRPWRQADERA